MRSVKYFRNVLWTSVYTLIFFLVSSSNIVFAGSTTNPVVQKSFQPTLCIAEPTLANGTMVCNAGDISISSGSVVDVVGTGECQIGEMLEVLVNMEVQMNTGADRYDVLLWSALSEQNIQEPNGSSQCYVSSLPDNPENIYVLDLEASENYTSDSQAETQAVKPVDRDALDQCRDIAASPDDTLINQDMTTTTSLFLPCIDTDGDGQVNAQFLVSWSTNPGHIQACGSGSAVLDPDFSNLSKTKCDAVSGNIPVTVVIPPRLTLVKTVNNDNGGTAIVTDWTLSATGPTPISGVSGAPEVTYVQVDAGVYTLSEAGGPAGYTPDAWSCDGGILSVDQLTLANEEEVTCTINNVADAATLTLAKTVTTDNGGTAGITDWTLSASGPTPISGVSGAAAVTAAPVSAGVYTLSETGGPAGYTAGAWGCSAGTLVGAELTLALGETAVCTINNDDNAATLTLVKTVTNNSGGTAGVTDWTLSASGPTPISGVSGAAAVTAAPVSAGVYTLSESAGPGGYNAGAWGCSAGTLVGAELTLALGETAVCTINNDDIGGGLSIFKAVVNDSGGTLTPADFDLHLTGGVYTGAEVFASGATPTVSTGVAYTLSETAVPNYTQTPVNPECIDSATTEPVAHPVTLAPEQDVVCTITNDDDSPTLTLAKTVTTDNGGTAGITDWTLSASGPTPISGVSGAAAVTAAPVKAGVYTLSETGGPAGYTPGDWGCDAGTLVGAELTLALGETAVCTINNDDNAATLTLAKTVTNNNGGTAGVTDWTLSASGPTPISGVSGAAAVTAAPVSAGVYTLSETGGPTGYTAGTWGCDAGTLVGAELTLALGETAVCTINNDDDAATLTLIKTVTNDNGGTALPTDWTLSASGPTSIFGASGSAAVTAAPVSAGVYMLSETGGPTGYTAGTWSCDAGTLVGAELTLALGETAVCTINNDDGVANLTLIKVVDNGVGGTATDSSWTLNAAGPTPVTGQSGAVAVTVIPVDPGVYTLSESGGPGGYTAEPWVCDGGSLAGNLLTLVVGDVASCTITNVYDYVPPVVPVPVNNTLALILLTLMLLATGWYFRPAAMRRF